MSLGSILGLGCLCRPFPAGFNAVGRMVELERRGLGRTYLAAVPHLDTLPSLVGGELGL